MNKYPTVPTRPSQPSKPTAPVDKRARRVQAAIDAYERLKDGERRQFRQRLGLEIGADPT